MSWQTLLWLVTGGVYYIFLAWMMVRQFEFGNYLNCIVMLLLGSWLVAKDIERGILAYSLWKDLGGKL